jgi:hypothetical protein
VPNLAVAVPLALAALLAAAVVLFVRRASGALRATRQVERFQEEAAALGRRLDALLDTTITQVDAVRRHQVAAPDVIGDLHAVMESLERGFDDAQALDAPALQVAHREGIVSEIRHAQRALDMVLHGCELVAGPRARLRTAESQIAIKRGYLNLLHAREALADHIDNLAAARNEAESAWRTFRV